jgi:hypothetical protein
MGFSANYRLKWVVITTIYLPRVRILDFVELGWNVVVVGDSKTDDYAWTKFENENENIHYLSLLDQEKLFPEISSQIGLKTYARKNIGYLYAAKNGAQEIFDTDDDTFIRDGAHEFFKDSLAYQCLTIKGTDYFNPYIYFSPNSGLWPRGYPLSQVAKDRYLPNPSMKIVPSLKEVKFDILQTLVNLEPDVDSIFRMTVGDEARDFSISRDVVVISKPTVSPANTQSTFWKSRNKFEYLYVPRWVSFRFSDILKMYVAQHFATLAYSGFWTEQIRNPHDYMDDFKSEIECFLNTHLVVEMLRHKEFASLVSVYEELGEMQICRPEEVQLAKLFAEQMGKIINE